MKYIMEAIWTMVFLLAGTLGVKVAIYLSAESGIFLSGLGGLATFVVALAVMALVVWSITDRLIAQASVGQFTSDESGVRFENEHGVVKFKWDDLSKIEILTNDKGPLEEDTFWVFHDQVQNKTITIPQGKKKDKSIKKAVMARYHSSDEMRIDMAMASATDKRFLIWQSLHASTATEKHAPKGLVNEVGMQREVAQNNWVVGIIVLLASVSYGTYFLVKQHYPDFDVWDGLAGHSIELFGLTLIAQMTAYLYAANDLKRFQMKHPSIDNTEALDGFKTLVRRHMKLALFLIVLLMLCFLFLAMVADHFGGKSAFFAAVALTITSVVFSQWYDPQEKNFKQIPCTDTTLEYEVQAVITSWQKDLWPKF